MNNNSNFTYMKQPKPTIFISSTREDGIKEKFSKEINFNNEANGIYFIQITIGNQTFNRKVILVK